MVLFGPAAWITEETSLRNGCWKSPWIVMYYAVRCWNAAEGSSVAVCGSFLCSKDQKVESIQANFPGLRNLSGTMVLSPRSVTKAVKYSPEYSVNESENYEEKLVTVLKVEKSRVLFGEQLCGLHKGLCES